MTENITTPENATPPVSDTKKLTIGIMEQISTAKASFVMDDYGVEFILMCQNECGRAFKSPVIVAKNISNVLVICPDCASDE